MVAKKRKGNLKTCKELIFFLTNKLIAMNLSQKVRHLLILSIICWFAFFHNNGAQTVGIMEARNLVTAHEMVEYDNWIVPTMNGELRLEKPPLPTWVAAVVESISPENIALQRAMAGITALLLVFFLYLLAFSLSNSRNFSFIASLVLATSLYVIIMGRSATWDIYCHAFMLGAIYFFYEAFKKEGPSWKEFLLSGIFMGLSFLSKGPVAFFALLLPFLIAFFIVYRPSFKGKIISLIVMVVIMLVISFWWPVYLYFMHREEAMFVAQKESTAWVNRNVKPWYRYSSFPVQSGLWAMFLTISLVFPYARKRFSPYKEYRLVMIWTLMAVFLLSLFPEKKERYLFPVLIPAACCVTFYLSYIFKNIKENSLKKYERLMFNIAVGIPAAVCVSAPVVMYILFYSKGQLTIIHYISTSLLFIVLGLCLFTAIIKKNHRLILGGLVGIMVLVEVSLFSVVSGSLERNDVPKIDELKKVERLKDIPFFTSEKDLRIEVVYLAGRRILYWDIEKENIPTKGLPIVLVSTTHPDIEINNNMREKINVEYIGKYDNNRTKKGVGKYRDFLVTYVSILTEKKQ